jgi:hypothetical protein
MSAIRAKILFNDTPIQNKNFWEELIAYLPLVRHGPHRKRKFLSASNRNEYQESSWGVEACRLARKTDNLTAICEPIV